MAWCFPYNINMYKHNIHTQLKLVQPRIMIYFFQTDASRLRFYPHSYCFLATMPVEKPGQVPDTQRRTGGFGEPRAVFTGEIEPVLVGKNIQGR